MGYVFFPGEVHSGRLGKPGAVSKVFCPGSEAEQQKHESIVWSVYGEYCFACGDMGIENRTEGTKIDIFVVLWFVSVEAGHSVCLVTTQVNVSTSVYVDVFRGEEGALRQVTSLLTQMVNSSTGKSSPLELLK